MACGMWAEKQQLGEMAPWRQPVLALVQAVELSPEREVSIPLGETLWTLETVCGVEDVGAATSQQGAEAAASGTARSSSADRAGRAAA